MSYLRIRNWEHYQNADIFKKAKGKPPWVKLYTAMLEDDDLLRLDLVTQLLFDRLLLLAARNANAISNDSQEIANRVRIPADQVAKGIQELLKGAWLSETKTARGSRKSSRKILPLEVRSKKLEESPKSPLDFKCGECGIVKVNVNQLEEHLANVHGIEPAAVVPLDERRTA